MNDTEVVQYLERSLGVVCFCRGDAARMKYCPVHNDRDLMERLSVLGERLDAALTDAEESKADAEASAEEAEDSVRIARSSVKDSIEVYMTDFLDSDDTDALFTHVLEAARLAGKTKEFWTSFDAFARKVRR